MFLRDPKPDQNTLWVHYSTIVALDTLLDTDFGRHEKCNHTVNAWNECV